MGKNDPPTLSEPCSLLVALQPQGSKPPLFCLHGPDGQVLEYQSLVRQLNPDQPVYGIQAQWLDGREEPLDRIEEIAAHYIEEMFSVQPRGPFYLAGLCYGGTVAFEMVRQLRRRGQQVALLALIDAPAIPYRNFLPRTTLLAYRLQCLVRKIPLHLHNLLQLSYRQRWEYVASRMHVYRDRLGRRFRGTSCGLKLRATTGATDSSLHSTVEKSKRARRTALTKYRPQPQSVRITFFRAQQRRPEKLREPEQGWSRLAAGGVEVYEIPGNHATIIQEPHVQVLAEHLKSCLEKAVSVDQRAGKSHTQDGHPSGNLPV
jgi:thioesterase domain-containing protein